MRRKIVLTTVILAVYLLGIVTYSLTDKIYGDKMPQVTEQNGFDLLAKRIFIEDPNEPIIAFTDLRTEINKYFLENNISGSLYFEYLPTGTSIRVGTEERRIAASLIKLPFAMEAYYAKEKGLIDFNQQIIVTEAMLNSNFGDLYKKGAGTVVTIHEAVELMLKDSDNTALNALASAMEGVVPKEEGPFNFLDAEFVQNEDYTVSPLTPRAYSSFLKCLYFSCYLTKSNSQEVLSLLTQSSLGERIPSGLPKDIKVAHKVGNYYDQTQSDCGIIYIPKRNYLLCVMLDDIDSPETNNKIATISKITYDYVSSH